MPEDVTVTVGDDHVGVVELRRPPNNFFDIALIRALAAAYESLDGDDACRVILLCSEGKHFCAGANLGGGPSPAEEPRALYREAVRLFAASTPRSSRSWATPTRRPTPILHAA